MMSAQGGGGGTPKADAVRKLSKGGYVKMQIRGEGVKKSGNLADVVCTWPLTFHALNSPMHANDGGKPDWAKFSHLRREADRVYLLPRTSYRTLSSPADGYFCVKMLSSKLSNSWPRDLVVL